MVECASATKVETNSLSSFTDTAIALFDSVWFNGPKIVFQFQDYHSGDVTLRS